MPNHVKNVLQINGTKEQVKEVYNRFSTFHEKEPRFSYDGDETYENKENPNDYGWYNPETDTFKQRGKADIDGLPSDFVRSYDNEYTRFPDFDKIIPRPEELNIISDGFLMPLENQFSAHKPFKESLDELRKFLGNDNGRTEESKQDTVKNFLQGVENYIKYGHATWYGWARDKWGTKWNAYDFETLNENTFSFDTAWSGVPDLIVIISETFPDIEFIYKYSDEDTGCNCGIYKLKNGIVEKNILENSSKEAYDLAFEIRPDYKENYVLIDNEYKYKDEYEEEEA